MLVSDGSVTWSDWSKSGVAGLYQVFCVTVQALQGGAVRSMYF